MSHEDIAAGRKFKDGIARSCYFIDIHSPTGSGFDHEKTGTRGDHKESYAPPKGDWYEVPFRSLAAPRGVANLLVPCRALGATHEGSAAIRVMATMTATGEAAGLAAAEALRRGCGPAEIDGATLRAKLGYLDQGPDYDELWRTARGRGRRDAEADRVSRDHGGRPCRRGGRREKRAAAVLVEEIERRTGVKLAVRAGRPGERAAILLATGASLGSEGYLLEVTSASGRGARGRRRPTRPALRASAVCCARSSCAATPSSLLHSASQRPAHAPARRPARLPPKPNAYGRLEP